MKLSIKIWKEGKWYIARCPELRVTSQGKTLSEAKRNLREAAELQIECILNYLLKHRKMKFEKGRLVPA